MIYCVWYPSGGFGHFINSILTVYGQDFARPNNAQMNFAQNGNAHAFELVAPKYSFDPKDYAYDFKPQFNYSVLIDNGINDENIKFKTVFPQANVIKMCYTHRSWPVVAKTMISKALGADFSQVLSTDQGRWNSTEVWAVREKYFLYLRDHALRDAWKPQNDTKNICIDNMFNYFTFHHDLSNTGVVMHDFFDLWQQWRKANRNYIDPVENAISVVDKIKRKHHVDLSYIQDVWSQAVLYYFLWLEFGQEVPHNDYADFFNNTKQICDWLKI
jgi:hypothetical protein